MNYKQKYLESCLGKSIIISLHKLNKSYQNLNELDMLIAGLKDKNFVLGHLKYTLRKTNINFNWYVGNKIFYDFIKKQKIPKKLKLKTQKINIQFIDTLLKGGPIIVYIDQFHLWDKKLGLYYKYHDRHFIVILKKIKRNYEIIDPHEGKFKEMTEKSLKEGIKSLRNRFWQANQIIQIQK